MNSPHRDRIMACDLRPQKLGYAVFEFRNEMQLIDWGGRRFYKDRGHRPIIGDFLQLLRPSVLVLRRPLAGGQKRPHFTQMVRKVVKEAHASKTRIAWLSERSLTRFFQRSGQLTKQQMATSMAELFPEVAWRVPPARKPWQPQDWRMPLFDAIALGFGYFALKLDPMSHAEDKPERSEICLKSR